MQHPLKQTWKLENLFAGGSDSEAFEAFLDELNDEIAQFRVALKQAKPPQSGQDTTEFLIMIAFIQRISAKLKEATAFTECLTAENQQDRKAVVLTGRVTKQHADYLATLTLFDQFITSFDEGLWTELLQVPALSSFTYILNERRTLALEKMAPALEALAADLAVDGYHGWGELYSTTVSHVLIPFEEAGERVQLSVGQAANKLSSPDREVRRQVFANWEEAWSAKADFCADALNHLGGYRLQLYKHRGWEDVHKEPLAMNRMSNQTLQVMWEVIDRNKGILIDYFKRKAKLLGLESLTWYDVDAPIASAEKKISYDDAADFVVAQFRKFSPKMANFAEMAFEQQWLEVEDRPGKRPGGFCTSLPVSRQTRIFMTFAGTLNNVSTLAHELGHAYHQHVMNDLPELLQDYAMNVAETASTFAELIVSDAAVHAAETREEKIALLEDKVQRAVAFFINIHARFIFETEFYELRKKSPVSAEQLNELMVKAQKQAFNDTLAEYHPHFWASKLHFYLTDVPFYNFPYTFGFLFSAGIYAQALQEGASFEDRYVALLRDTGAMTVEELAQKHLHADLTQADFWQNAVDHTLKDARLFLQMTE